MDGCKTLVNVCYLFVFIYYQYDCIYLLVIFTSTIVSSCYLQNKCFYQKLKTVLVFPSINKM